MQPEEQPSRKHENFDEILERELEPAIQRYKNGEWDAVQLSHAMTDMFERMAFDAGISTDTKRLNFVFRDLNWDGFTQRLNKVASMYGAGSTKVPPIKKGDFRDAMDRVMEEEMSEGKRKQE